MAVKTKTMPDGVGLIEVTGSLLAGPEIGELRNAVKECIERQATRLLIDFADATYMNSSAMGVLVSALTSYTKRRWELKICCLNNSINAIFVITKLNRVFAISKTREEAIEMFSRGLQQ